MALTVATLPHALTVEGLSARQAPPGATARDVGLEAGWSGWLNGVAVADPDAPLPDDGVLVLRRGVAGDGDSDPLRVALQFALLAATLAIPGAGWAAGLSGWQVGAIQAAAVIGGNVVINAIAPVTPAVDDDPAVPERAWTLSGGGNRARPNGPLPLVLGTHRVYPDLAARAYATFDGRVPLRDALIVNSARARPAGVTNARWAELRDLPEFQAPRESAAGGSVDQFLHQIFNFGLGDLDISELKVGETALADLDEATTQWSDAQGAITLVRGNVDTAAGDALDTDWTQRATPPNTVEIGLDFAAQLFRLAGGGVAEQSVAVEIEVWNVKTPTEKRAWDVTFKHAATTPFRVTLRTALDGAGAYQVRVKRAAAASSDDAVSDDVAWTALRSHQEDGADYAGQTRLAVRLRATAQVNGRLDRLSAVAKQKIPVWETPEGATEPAWSAPKPSSNPAWLFRWYALGIRRGAKLLAGAGLPPTRVDDALLKRWGAWCDEQGLGCDFVVDRDMTHWEVLSLIAQCGRAKPSWATGRLGAVWDAADVPATMWVGPQNVVAGSFEVDWLSGTLAEEIVCRYVEPSADWQRVSVRRSVPGVAAPDRTAVLDLPGVTSKEQAAKACNLQAASQKYHRRRMAWRMSSEGLAASRGTVAAVHGGLVDGGVTGRVAASLKPLRGAVAASGRPAADLGVDGQMFIADDGRAWLRASLFGSPPPNQDAITADGVHGVIWGIDDVAMSGTRATSYQRYEVGDERTTTWALNDDLGTVAGMYVDNIQYYPLSSTLLSGGTTNAGRLVLRLAPGIADLLPAIEAHLFVVLRFADGAVEAWTFDDDEEPYRSSTVAVGDVDARFAGAAVPVSVRIGRADKRDPADPASPWIPQPAAGGLLARMRLDRPISVPRTTTDPAAAWGGADEPMMLLRFPDGALYDVAARNGGEAEETASVLVGAPAAWDAAKRAAFGAALAAVADWRDVLWRYYEADAPPKRVRVVDVRPQTDGQVRIEAIDEVAEYYAAATSDLAVPLPDVHARAPAVLRIDVAERLLRAGGGWAVELTAALTVQGDWRGGEVWAAYDGGESRLAARLGPGETDAAWLAPASGQATIRAIPGSAAAPAGAIRSLEWTIGGSLGAPAAPANFSVVAVSGGYLAEWAPSIAPDYAATEVLDAPYQASAALPRTAQRRQLADATAYSRVGAGEARLRVWARHVNHAGQQGPAATADVTPDPSGGMTWRGDWTTGTKYAVDDAVSNDGRSWICTTAHTAAGSTGPTTDSHANWDLLANKGDDGIEGEGIDWRGAWASGTAYAIDDAVSHDGRSWICTTAHTAGRAGPTTDSHANWDLLADRGKKGVTWRGAWAARTAYAVDDAVSNDGRSWICTTAHTAGRTGPTEDSHANWGLLAERGDDGVDGEGIDWRGAWASGTRYEVDDAVSHDGRSWICTRAHQASSRRAPGDNANWNLLADRGVGAVTVSHAVVEVEIAWDPDAGDWATRGGTSSILTRVSWYRDGAKVATCIVGVAYRPTSSTTDDGAECRAGLSGINRGVAGALPITFDGAAYRRPPFAAVTPGNPCMHTVAAGDAICTVIVKLGSRPAAAPAVTTVSTPTYGFFLRGQYPRSETVRVTWTKGSARRVIDVTARARSSAANVEIFDVAVAGGTLGRVAESAYAWQSASSAQRTYTVDGVDAVITAVDMPEGP